MGRRRPRRRRHAPGPKVTPHKDHATPKRPSPGRLAAKRRQVRDAVGEGVLWGMVVVVLGMVSPGRNPGDPHGGRRVVYSLVFGLTIGVVIAVSKAEGVFKDQLQGRMPSRRQWLVMVLTTSLFPVPVLILLLVDGRMSWSNALWALVVILMAVARGVFAMERRRRDQYDRGAEQ